MPISVRGQDESDAELATIRRSKGKEGSDGNEAVPIGAVWCSLGLSGKKKKRKEKHAHTTHA